MFFKKIVLIFLILSGSYSYGFNNYFAEGISCQADAPEDQAMTRRKNEIRQAIHSILLRIRMPYITPDTDTLSFNDYFRTLHRVSQESGQGQVDVFVAGGVIRSLLSYLYLEVKKIKDRNADLGISEILGNIAERINPVENYLSLGVGSDIDVLLRVNGVDTSIKTEIMARLKDFMMKLSANQNITKLQGDDFSFMNNFVPAPDVKDFITQQTRALNQGGSLMDFLAMDVDTGEILEPNIIEGFSAAPYSRVFSDFVCGNYHYVAPPTGGRVEDKQTIRGLRPLVQLPFLRVADETQIRSEMQAIIDSGGELSPKARLQFAKLQRNSVLGGANNRFRQAPAGTLEHLASELIEPKEFIKNQDTSNRGPSLAKRGSTSDKALADQIDLILKPRESFPKEIYHGTRSLVHVIDILRAGFFHSSVTPGRTQGQAVFGPGVYTSDSEETALMYTADTNVVFELKLKTDSRPRILDYSDLEQQVKLYEAIEAKALALYSEGKNSSNIRREKIFFYLREHHNIDVIINTHTIVQNQGVFEIVNPLRKILEALARVPDLGVIDTAEKALQAYKSLFLGQVIGHILKRIYEHENRKLPPHQVVDKNEMIELILSYWEPEVFDDLDNQNIPVTFIVNDLKSLGVLIEQYLGLNFESRNIFVTKKIIKTYQKLKNLIGSRAGLSPEKISKKNFALFEAFKRIFSDQNFDLVTANCPCVDSCQTYHKSNILFSETREKAWCHVSKMGRSLPKLCHAFKNISSQYKVYKGKNILGGIRGTRWRRGCDVDNSFITQLKKYYQLQGGERKSPTEEEFWGAFMAGDTEAAQTFRNHDGFVFNGPSSWVNPNGSIKILGLPPYAGRVLEVIIVGSEPYERVMVMTDSSLIQYILKTGEVDFVYLTSKYNTKEKGFLDRGDLSIKGKEVTSHRNNQIFALSPSVFVLESEDRKSQEKKMTTVWTICPESKQTKRVEFCEKDLTTFTKKVRKKTAERIEAAKVLRQKGVTVQALPWDAYSRDYDAYVDRETYRQVLTKGETQYRVRLNNFVKLGIWKGSWNNPALTLERTSAGTTTTLLNIPAYNDDRNAPQRVLDDYSLRFNYLQEHFESNSNALGRFLKPRFIQNKYLISLFSVEASHFGSKKKALLLFKVE